MDDFNENAVTKAQENGGTGDLSAAKVADESAEGNKPLNELQIALKDKFVAEKVFVGGSQTRKADAETLVLEVRRLEALAEVKRLEADTERLRVERAKIEAERAEREANAKFISGPSSYKTRLEGHKSKYEMIMGVVVLFCILSFLFAVSR